jgi:hypothetical protein
MKWVGRLLALTVLLGLGFVIGGHATPPIGGPDVILNDATLDTCRARVVTGTPTSTDCALVVWSKNGAGGSGGGGTGVILDGNPSTPTEARVMSTTPSTSTPGLVVHQGGPITLDPATAITAVVSSVKAANVSPTVNDTSLVVAASPNPAPVCTSSVAINQTASATVITGTASQFLYICSIFLMSATAQNVSVTEGTGTVCATSEDALIGGTTASVAVGVTGGMVITSGVPWLKTKQAGENLCVEQSGAGNVSGIITYADHV